MLPLALGSCALALSVAAAALAPKARTLALVAASYLLVSLCLASVLWGNAHADASTLEDTAQGWYFGAVALLCLVTLLCGVATVRYLRARRAA